MGCLFEVNLFRIILCRESRRRVIVNNSSDTLQSMLECDGLSLVFVGLRGGALRTPNLSKCKLIIASPLAVLGNLIADFSSLLILLVYGIISLN